MSDGGVTIDGYTQSGSSANTQNFPAALDTALKIVLDGSNATPSLFLPEILRDAGCEVIEQNTELDGNFPLGTPDPTEHEVLATEVWGATDAQNTWHVQIGGKQVTDYAVYWDPATGLHGRDNSTLAVVYKDNDNNVYFHRLLVLPPKSTEHGYQKQCERIVQECQSLQISRVIVEGTAGAVQGPQRRDRWRCGDRDHRCLRYPGSEERRHHLCR